MYVLSQFHSCRLTAGVVRSKRVTEELLILVLAVSGKLTVLLAMWRYMFVTVRNLW